MDEIEGLKTIIENLFDFWDLSPSERTKLAKAIGSGVFERNCALLLSIHKSLGLLFPQNEEIKRTWVKRKNKDLGNKRPLDIMVVGGTKGMEIIRKYCGGLIND